MDTISVGGKISANPAGLSYVDYSLRLNYGQTVMIELKADGNPYLEIYTYDNLVASSRLNDGHTVAWDFDLESDHFREIAMTNGQWAPTNEEFYSISSRLAFTAPHPGDFVVRVWGFRGGMEGGFTLSVHEYEYPKITFGETISTTSESYVAYLLTLNEGQTVTIDLQADWDPLLEIYRDGVLLASDDNSGGNRNSRLTFTAPSSDFAMEDFVTGDFVIRVRSYGSAEAKGAFTLSVRGDEDEYEYLKIAVGETASTSSTSRVAYLLTLNEGQTVTIDLQAADWDTFLEIYGNGELLASDDDSGGGSNSRLIFTAPSSGDFVIRVRSYGIEEAEGAFTLSVSEP